MAALRVMIPRRETRRWLHGYLDRVAAEAGEDAANRMADAVARLLQGAPDADERMLGHVLTAFRETA